MAYHIDIMKNDPTSTGEYRLACVRLEGGHIEVDAADRAYWRNLLRDIVQVDPDDQPERFFRALGSRVDGTYVYATEPHDEAHCPMPRASGSYE